MGMAIMLSRRPLQQHSETSPQVRLTISHELGHERPQIVVAYLWCLTNYRRVLRLYLRAERVFKPCQEPENALKDPIPIPSGRVLVFYQ